MKNLVILFVLVIFALEIKGECSVQIPYFPDAQCGYASECVYHGINKADITNEACRRREQGKPPFFAVKEGNCPTNSPKCI